MESLGGVITSPSYAFTAPLHTHYDRQWPTIGIEQFYSGATRPSIGHTAGVSGVHRQY